MEELIQMVREGRLHEADERQLETLRLVKELQKTQAEPTPFDPTLLEQIKEAVVAALASAPAIIEGTKIDAERPEMRHTSLSDIVLSDSNVSISHGEGLGEEKTGTDDSAAKLEKLKKLKKKR
jgi:hypothetical protein